MVAAPTADELLQNPLVKAALDQAWVDSLPSDPQRRHEEGGWILMEVSSGKLTVVRAPVGYGAELELSPPAVLPMSVVVAKFHTHPNPTAEGWDPRPSDRDLRQDDLDGVPDLVVSDSGVFVSGPLQRRGGLKGPSGYPT